MPSYVGLDRLQASLTAGGSQSSNKAASNSKQAAADQQQTLTETQCKAQSALQTGATHSSSEPHHSKCSAAACTGCQRFLSLQNIHPCKRLANK
jgi:hypothetical protein